MNLKNVLNRIRKSKKIPFDVFSKSLQDKLIELGYDKYESINRINFYLFFYNKNENINWICPYFCVDKKNEYINFTNNNESDPYGCWHNFCRPEDYTKENLDKLFEKATLYATHSKECKVQFKLDELEKDFEQ